MIKGLTRRVIVVKSPDDRYFEQAIFVVKDELLRERGADSSQILKEARKVANSYVSGTKRGKNWLSKGVRALPAPLLAAAAGLLLPASNVIM